MNKDMDQLIWQGLRMELPADWEMLQLSKDPKLGRCAFADRYQFRFELNWRRIEGDPDFGRVMSDYRSQIETSGKMADVKAKDRAGWRGFEGHTDKILNSRLCKYFPNEHLLVEIVFLWPDKPDRDLQDKILPTIGEAPVVRSKFRRWRAFGMDLLSQDCLPFEKCAVQPALAEFTFADEKTGVAEVFSRRGLVEQWLKTPVKDWLSTVTPKGAAAEPGRPVHMTGDHNIEVVTGTKRAPGLRGIAAPSLQYEARAWICPVDGRLYHSSLLLDSTAGAKSDVDRLSCCPQKDLQL